MNKIAVLIIATILVFSTSTPIMAQEDVSTDSAQEESTKNLKTRIEKVVQEKREQIKGVIEKISQRPRGFIGEVDRISEESLTIKNSKGVQILPIDESTEILKNSESIDLSEIEIENWVVVMGIESQDSFTVKRILVSEDSLSLREYFVELGTIKDISSNSITLSPRSQDETIEYDLTKSTIYQDLNGNEIENDLLEEESQVLIVGYKTDEGNIATKIRSLAIIEEDEE